jgi:hypothetical protein
VGELQTLPGTPLRRGRLSRSAPQTLKLHTPVRKHRTWREHDEKLNYNALAVVPAVLWNFNIVRGCVGCLTSASENATRHRALQGS